MQKTGRREVIAVEDCCWGGELLDDMEDFCHKCGAPSKNYRARINAETTETMLR